MDPLTEAGIVWGAEVKRSVRSARVITLLGLYTMFTAVVLLIFAFITRSLQRQIDDRLAEAGGTREALEPQMDQVRQGFVGWLFTDDSALVESLTNVPILVLVVFKITLIFLPLYIAVMGFDQISGEIAPRSIRYLTVRARRSSIMTGKFLAQASVLVGLVLVVDLGIFLVARAVNPDFAFPVMIAALVKCWLAATVFSLAYLALTTFCSALFRSPAVSLIFNFALLFVFWLLNAAGAWALANNTFAVERLDQPSSPVLTAMSWLRYITPSHYSANLLHPRFAEFGTSTAIYAAFAAVFLACAYAVLRRRDL